MVLAGHGTPQQRGRGFWLSPAVPELEETQERVPGPGQNVQGCCKEPGWIKPALQTNMLEC